MERKALSCSPSGPLSHAQGQELNEHSIKILNLCSSIKSRVTINAKSNQLEMECKLDIYSQMLNRGSLNSTRKGNLYPEIRERICFTFYPIASPGRDVKFKYSTELHFCILKWMKQHLMTYYKTIFISSKLSYISQPDYKWSHTKTVKEAHLSHWRLLQVRFQFCHRWVMCNPSWIAH